MPRRPFTRKITRLPDRKLVEDGRFALSDGVGIESYDGFGPAYLGDSPVNSPETAKIMEDDWVEDGHKVDYRIGQDLLMEDYLRDTLGKRRRVENDGRFLMTDGTKNEDTNGHGPGKAIRGEFFGDYLGKVNSISHDDQVFTGDWVESDSGNFLGKIGRETDADPFFMNDRLQKGHHVDSGIRPFKSTEQLSNILDRRRRPIDDSKSLMSERVETKRSFDVDLGPLCSSEHLETPLGKGRRAIYEGMFPIGDKIVNRHDMDNSFGLPLSFEYSGRDVGKDRHVSDGGSFRKSDRVENGRMDIYTGPAMSSEYNAISTKQNHLLYFSKPKIGTDYSLLQDQLGDSSTYPRLPGPQIFHSSYPTSRNLIGTRASPHDTKVTRASPHNSRGPSFNFGRSSSFVANHNTSPWQECTPYHDSEGNLFSSHKIRSSPHLQPKGLSRCLDAAASGYGDKFPLPTTISHLDYTHCLTSNSLSNVGYSENRELDTSAYDGYRDSLFSEPFSKDEIYKKENEGPLSHASGFNKNQSFAFDNEYHVVPGGEYEHSSLRYESNERFSGKYYRFSDANKSLGIHCHERELISQGNESSQVYEGMHPDSKCNRTSVFARLSSAPTIDAVEQQENDNQMIYDDNIDASVDEVMDTLHQYQNHRVKKLRKSTPLLKQHVNDKIAWNKEHSAFEKHVDYDDLEMKAMRVKMAACQAIEDNDDQMPKETRVVNFKRKSETKKIADETRKKGSVSLEVGKDLSGRRCQRRKLVRPVFIKKDPCDEGVRCDGSPYQQLHYQESPIKINSISHEDLGKVSENSGMPSCNVGSATFNGNSVIAEQGLNFKGIKSKEHSGAFRYPEGEDEKNVLENSEICRVSSKKRTPRTRLSVRNDNYTEDGLFQDHPGMISSSYIAHESSPGMGKELSDHGNCRGDTDSFQSVENAPEICTVVLETIKPKSNSKLVEPEIGKVTKAHVSTAQIGEGKLLDC